MTVESRVRAVVRWTSLRNAECEIDGSAFSGPEHMNFQVEVIEGSAELFDEWFLEVSQVYAYGLYPDQTILDRIYGDLDGSHSKFVQGSVIEIGFSSFFDAWLSRRCQYESNQLRFDADAALRRLNTGNIVASSFTAM